MFSKTADSTAAPTRPTGGTNQSNKSILAADLKITGDIKSSGSIELLGEVDGTLEASSVVVGGDGRMTGDITATDVEIRGRHDGRVASQTITLRASAQMRADISYTTLVIESGAQIEGRFTRTKG